MLFPSMRRLMYVLTLRRSRQAEFNRRARRFQPMLAILEDRALPSTVHWIGGSGDWSVGTHWDTGHVPGAMDDVVINVTGVTVTHSTGTDSVHSLTSQDAFVLSGGTLSLAMSSVINNTFTLSGGALLGAGTSR